MAKSVEQNIRESLSFSRYVGLERERDNNKIIIIGWLWSLWKNPLNLI